MHDFSANKGASQSFRCPSCKPKKKLPDCSLEKCDGLRANRSGRQVLPHLQAPHQEDVSRLQCSALRCAVAVCAQAYEPAMPAGECYHVCITKFSVSMDKTMDIMPFLYMESTDPCYAYSTGQDAIVPICAAHEQSKRCTLVVRRKATALLPDVTFKECTTAAKQTESWYCWSEHEACVSRAPQESSINIK